MRVMQFAEKPSIIVKQPRSSKTPLSCAAEGNLPSVPMPAQTADEATISASPVVLDTNVVLDLWLFGDARAQPLQQALQAGRLIALVTPPMLAELADVLSRAFAKDWPVPPAKVLATLQVHSRLVNPPLPSAPAPRCTDTDDQKFIDLAWAWPTGLLFSRDRAVLKLASAARRHGLQITTPERWAAQQAVS